jgi:hypothetical protein
MVGLRQIPMGRFPPLRLSSFVAFRQVDLLIKVENLGFVIPSEWRGIFSGIIPYQPSCGFQTEVEL